MDGWERDRGGLECAHVRELRKLSTTPNFSNLPIRAEREKRGEWQTSLVVFGTVYISCEVPHRVWPNANSGRCRLSRTGASCAVK